MTGEIESIEMNEAAKRAVKSMPKFGSLEEMLNISADVIVRKAEEIRKNADKYTDRVLLMTNAEIKEQALITNQLATEISECLDYEPWHINWITRSSAGVVQAWEPDNTCIYEGTKLNAACRALKLSNYGG